MTHSDTKKSRNERSNMNSMSSDPNDISLLFAILHKNFRTALAANKINIISLYDSHAKQLILQQQQSLLAVKNLSNKSQNFNIGEQLSARADRLAVSAWNVKTLMDVASQAIIVHTLSKYRVDIVCLPQVRNPHFGSRVITNPCSEQKYWLYCGATDNSGRNGVAIVISEKAHCASIEVETGYNAAAVASKIDMYGDLCAKWERLFCYAEEHEQLLASNIVENLTNGQSFMYLTML
ncbi:unnamed protein product [Dracunculus medinensis]|uniref:DUF3700 domain-containing protein n=1 Tax=Dracunculus medinensis TaxID=318479 RepID=A0A0N4UPH4_DRAME|nr:unnamed protein product [Dracunculus medinensis]